MRKFKAFILFIIIVMACHSVKNIASLSEKNVVAASPISFVVLQNYAVNSAVLPPQTIDHKFIVTAKDFNKTFHMTKATPGTAVVPDFDSQSVVAIILPPTEKVMSIDIHKAEISESNLNFYYTITDTTSWLTYTHTIKALAAIAKNDSIKQVNFYNNNVKEKTVLVNY